MNPRVIDYIPSRPDEGFYVDHSVRPPIPSTPFGEQLLEVLANTLIRIYGLAPEINP